MFSDSEASGPSSSDTESGSDLNHLTINEHYAKAFHYKKEREELARLKEKYGSDASSGGSSDESTDSEEDVSEDEDGEELTPAVDAAILRTLARIKRKEPDIYDAKKAVFNEEQEKTSVFGKVKNKAERNKSKPVTLRQAKLASALNTTSRSPSPSPAPDADLPPTHVQEQRALRAETIAAFHGGSDHDDDEESEDDLLVPREKTRDEIEQEEEEYREFLAREVGDLRDIVTIEQDTAKVEVEKESESDKKEMKKKGKGEEEKNMKAKSMEKVKKSKEEADQEFLMNYILNRGWIDRSARHIPTYNEITGEPPRKSKSKGKGKAPTSDDGESDSSGEDGDVQGGEGDKDIDLDADEEFEDMNDVFESSYNFRFEEPDAATIKSYPRNLDSTVRRTDTTRKDARARRKERKKAELELKKQEVARLKALKMRELRQKLERIGREGGVEVGDDEAWQALDLDGEWDPDAHDQQMEGLYGQGEGEGADDVDEDLEKPTWDDDIDIGDIVRNEEAKSSAAPSKKKKKKKKDESAHTNAEGVDVDAMDADLAPPADAPDEDEDWESGWDGSEEARKRKIAAYLDSQVHALDFNALVGGKATRFHYTPVLPATYALSAAEVLAAPDKDLNEYVSVKKMAPYRKDGGRGWERNRGEKLREFKEKLGARRPEIEGARAHGKAIEGGEVKKRKGKKERMRMRAAEAGGAEADGEVAQPVDAKHDKIKKKRPRPDDDDDKAPHDNNGHSEEGASKRKRRRHKKSTAAAVAE